jgi:cytidylate kinase
MKRILVIEREYGAGGSVIAEKAAKRLGWKLFDHSLTEEVAKLARARPEVCAKCEERVDPWMYRLSKIFYHGSHERHARLEDSNILDADRLVCLAQKVIEDVAKAGHCVIVGRGAAYYLRERADTYCVFLYASRELKFRREVSEGKSEAEAIESVDTVDLERAEFVKHYFGAEWPNRHLFHAMLNTAMGDDATVDTILGLMEAANKREAAGKS